MVRHVVWIRFAEDAPADAGPRLRAELEALVGTVPGLLALEVGLAREDRGADAVLVADFESWEALDGYRAHPAHQAVLEWLRPAAASMGAVDYERPGA